MSSHIRSLIPNSILTVDKPKLDIGAVTFKSTKHVKVLSYPTHHELYKQIGIDPPHGVLLYGPPGTGKTILM